MFGSWSRGFGYYIGEGGEEGGRRDRMRENNKLRTNNNNIYIRGLRRVFEGVSGTHRAPSSGPPFEYRGEEAIRGSMKY